jgi:hypothetical protein
MDQIAKLEEQLSREASATYFIGRYYFVVNTFRIRRYFGLQSGDDFSIEVQRKVRSENAISLLHEYIHYIHEISTVMGNAYLMIDVALKSIFSNDFDKNPKSCKHLGLNTEDGANFEKFVQLHTTKETMNGHVMVDALILSVSKITIQDQMVQVPHEFGLAEEKIQLPIVTVLGFEGGDYKHMNLYLGKFFIYEGLAYELDRELERQFRKETDIRDTNICTEYTVLRLVANHLCPEATTRQYLSLASLSLSYLDAGGSLVSLLKGAKEAIEKRRTIEDYLDQERHNVRALLKSKIDGFNEAQDELVEVFRKRADLFKAFSALAGAAKDGYRTRADHPTFEVDLIFDGNYANLLDLVPICDYMYVFTDEDAFDRDIFGTASHAPDVSQSLRSLIAYDHYQKSHGVWSTDVLESKVPVKCPFFGCCALDLRRTHEKICEQKPWRIFEISALTDQKYCSYGAGVGEFKSHTEA